MDEEDKEASCLSAQELIREDRLDEAERLLSTIPRSSRFEGWSHERTLALIQLASKLGTKGARKRALELLTEAEASIDGLREGSTWEAPDCLMEIGRAFADLGNNEHAAAVLAKAGALAAERQAGDFECAKILAQVSEYLADIGSWDAATRVVKTIEVTQLRDQALNRLRNRRRGYLGRGLPE
jgi:hypothetical protein